MKLTKEDLRLAAERCDEVADTIEAVSVGMKRLLSGRLNDTALVMLIQAACPGDGKGRKPSRPDIRRVLEGIVLLDEKFLHAEDEEETS